MRNILDSIGTAIETADQYMYERPRGTAYWFFGFAVFSFMTMMLYMFDGWTVSAFCAAIGLVLSWFGCRVNAERARELEEPDSDFVQGAAEFSDR